MAAKCLPYLQPTAGHCKVRRSIDQGIKKAAHFYITFYTEISKTDIWLASNRIICMPSFQPA